MGLVEIEVAGPAGAELLSLDLAADPSASAPECEATPHVLYLHGFGSSSAGTKGRYFRQRALESGWGFAALDFRGHGRSGGGFRELTLTRCLADVAAALDRLAAQGGPGWRRPVLFGSSMGGLAALWSAVRAPERLAAVVALAPALDLADSALGRAGEEGAARWREAGSIGFDHEHEGTVTRHELAWGFVEDVRSFRQAELARLAVPVLAVQGQRDESVSWVRVAELGASLEARGAAHFELHLFADGDHRLTDRLPAVWRLAAGFVGTLPARSGVLG